MGRVADTVKWLLQNITNRSRNGVSLFIIAIVRALTSRKKISLYSVRNSFWISAAPLRCAVKNLITFDAESAKSLSCTGVDGGAVSCARNQPRGSLAISARSFRRLPRPNRLAAMYASELIMPNSAIPSPAFGRA